LVSRSEWELIRVAVWSLPIAEQHRIVRLAQEEVRTTYKGWKQLGWFKVTQREAQAEGYAPCPLLGPDGGCQVYQVRPSICRLYGYTCSQKSGYTYGCEIVQAWVEERGIQQTIHLEPYLEQMERSLWGESRPLPGWLFDPKEFKPRAPRQY